MKFNIKSKKIGKLLSDPVQYKLSIAQLSLEDIPNKMPVDSDSKKNYETLANIETFLAFLTSSFDALFSEINQNFSLNITDHELSKNINSKLSSSRQRNSSQVKKILDDYFSKPDFHLKKIITSEAMGMVASGLATIGIMNRVMKIMPSEAKTVSVLAEFHRFNPIIDSNVDYDKGYYKRYFDYSKSHLWIAKQMRNEIAHGRKIMTSLYYSVTSEDEKSTFLIRFVHKDGRNTRLFWDEQENPNKFFSNQLRLTRKMVRDIRKLL